MTRCVGAALIGAAVLFGGCRCRSTEPEPVVMPVAHYYEWDKLVARATRGNLEEARIIAVGLAGGVHDDLEVGAAGDANGKVGAALGFVGFAEDAVELADAVSSAAGGCGMCHASTGALPPMPRPAWTHETAADWAVWGLVWAEPAAPPEGGDEVLAGLVATWAEPLPPALDTGVQPAPDEVRTARLIAACAACHAKRDD